MESGVISTGLNLRHAARTADFNIATQCRCAVWDAASLHHQWFQVTQHYKWNYSTLWVKTAPIPYSAVFRSVRWVELWEDGPSSEEVMSDKFWCVLVV